MTTPKLEIPTADPMAYLCAFSESVEAARKDQITYHNYYDRYEKDYKGNLMPYDESSVQLVPFWTYVDKGFQIVDADNKPDYENETDLLYHTYVNASYVQPVKNKRIYI